jgi:hypothetical protein
MSTTFARDEANSVRSRLIPRSFARASIGFAVSATLLVVVMVGLAAL